MTDRVLVAHRVLCMDGPPSSASWVAVSGEHIEAVGTGDPPPAGETLRLDGFLLPGLIDAHVHLTTTGLYRRGLDLRDARSVDEALDLLARFSASSADEWIIGGNFDPGRNEVDAMPDRHQLDLAAGGRKVFISRTDGHSSALSSSALEAADIDPREQGTDLDASRLPTGVLRAGSNYAARRRVFSALPSEQVREAQEAACALALTKGITCVHEMAGGSYMGDSDFETLMGQRSKLPIHVVPYLSTLDVGRVAALGLKSIGGDLFLDGSIGSRTAAMTAAYADAETNGHLYHSDEEITAFFLEATSAGLQAGVHAIGDAAIEQALRCLENSAEAFGDRAMVRALRHRIEHFECVDPVQITRAAALGVVASVQPAFDAWWGGRTGMYAARLGERAWEMNPFSVMAAAGMAIAGGSDSTVTPLDPFLGMASAAGHHRPDFAVTAEQALRMFTSGAAYAAHEESERGSIQPGLRADFCLVDTDPLIQNTEELAGVQVLQTWVGGHRAWPL